jgi:ribosomal 50S subunit-associated protein YjgA (DUF615 family)
MNEQIKLTEGEIKEIRTLQDEFQRKLYQLGQNTLQRIKLKKSLDAAIQNEDKISSDWEAIEKTENTLVEKLLHKYGEGALDLTSGTFTPDKK